MDFSSKLLENAVNEVSQLPGIGKRTALRLVLHLMKQPVEKTQFLSDALLQFRETVRLCKRCHNICDEELCEICNNGKRDASVICVVEDIRDVMAIESTGQFFGLYHVLGGKISPMEGVGPSQLTIHSLVERIKNDNVKEVIFALSPTIEGDTTNFYIYRQIEHLAIQTSAIARGISIGDQLEFADEITLGRSIVHRIPFESSMKQN